MLKQRGGDQEVRTEVKRLWGETPVRDAKTAFKIILSAEDIATATPKQPGSCVYANCVARLTGARKILFFRTIAYIEMPDEVGQTYVERYIMSPAMAHVIKTFDTEGKSAIQPGTGYTLYPPQPSKTLEAHRKQTQRYTAAHKHAVKLRHRKYRQKAKLLGKKTAVTKVAKKSTRHVVMDMTGVEVRTGNGMVHFISK